MEIFKPGPVPYPGCYQCPRCNSREVYDSEKTINVSAITIDAPGPASSTIINRDKIHATRCRYCNTEALWLAHPKAVQEAKERKAKKMQKTIKVVFIVFGVILGIVIALNIFNSISKKIESNNFNQYRTAGNQKLEEVRAEWQSAAFDCNLGYFAGDRGVATDQVGIEKINKNPNHEYIFEPGVEIRFQIEAPEYSSFWKSKNGQALDCFSEKIYGAKFSEKLSLTDSQIPEQDSYFESIDFYDGVEFDGTVYKEGVIGDQNNHLDGYLAYSDSFGPAQFTIRMEWDLDKVCFNYTTNSRMRYTPEQCKNP